MTQEPPFDELTSPPVPAIAQIGLHRIVGDAVYLDDIQRWSPRFTISRTDVHVEDFVVPSGPECYRRNRDEALTVGWATARQWLGGGRILWRSKR